MFRRKMLCQETLASHTRTHAEKYSLGVSGILTILSKLCLLTTLVMVKS